MKVFPDSTIYVAAPANSATGGPELLHQLAYHLRRDLGLNAYMYYIPENHPSPIHPEYYQYGNPFVREIKDDEKNILIVPEVASAVSILKRYYSIKKCIWWLSVDNFYLTSLLSNRRNFLFYKIINKFGRIFFKKVLVDIPTKIYKAIDFTSLQLPPEVENVSLHLTQSYYAFNHLISKGIEKKNVLYLSDYLNFDFLKTEPKLSGKENIVVYNPKKGYQFTKRLINSARGINFVPIINMTRKEVLEILQRAKVYIDFGNHPGKDRIPREAAILGCCVITSRRGSAAFCEDVPIPDEYKFEDDDKYIPLIIDRIKDCFQYFENRYKDFDHYREIIKQEPEKFIEDLKRTFVLN